MNCEVLADGVPCSYRSETIGAPSAPGLLDELAGQGADVTNDTFAAAMIAYPSVSMGAAIDAWARDFPGLKLLVSEYNADFASTWTKNTSILGAGGAWMKAAANGGAHAIHWASGVLAGVNSRDGIVSGINYHSLQGSGGGSDNPGFGILDWAQEGPTVKANAVAQLMAYISELVSGRSMHSVRPGGAELVVDGAPAGLVIDSQKNLPALQSSAFSLDGSLTAVVINRGTRPVNVSVNVSQSGIYTGCVATGLSASLTAFSALDEGGWAEFDPAVQVGVPWAGPMHAAKSKVRLARVSPTVFGELVAPPLALVVAEIEACPRETQPAVPLKADDSSPAVDDPEVVSPEPATCGDADGEGGLVLSRNRRERI